MNTSQDRRRADKLQETLKKSIKKEIEDLRTDYTNWLENAAGDLDSKSKRSTAIIKETFKELIKPDAFDNVEKSYESIANINLIEKELKALKHGLGIQQLAMNLICKTISKVNSWLSTLGTILTRAWRLFTSYCHLREWSVSGGLSTKYIPIPISGCAEISFTFGKKPPNQKTDNN